MLRKRDTGRVYGSTAMQLLVLFYTSAGYKRRVITALKTSYFTQLRPQSCSSLFYLSSPVLLGQPQARSTPLLASLSGSSEAAALLRSGSKPVTQQAHSNGIKNGAPLLRAASSTSSSSSPPHKNPKKLQSNPSLNSQSSKRSKGSSKSNSSQIPTEAQDGESHLRGY